MIPADFKKQLDRLTATYGPKAYPQERADLLWNEFKSVGPQVFIEVVSKLISENSAAPMMPKFREAVAFFRERNWSQEKRHHANDASQFGDIHNAAEQSVSFTDYVCRAVKRNERAEMQSLLTVFGAPRIEAILAKQGKAS